MSSPVGVPPANIPVTDQYNNFTPAWYFFIQQLYVRAGGPISQNNNELIVGQLDDAGIEELKSDLYSLRDQTMAAAQLLQSMIDDLNNSPAVQQGYDYNPSAISVIGGTIDNVVIGNTTPSTGKFTDITNGNVAALIKTSVAMNNGAAAAAGTLLNSPVAGNPTKWLPINDNGTIRYIPAW